MAVMDRSVLLRRLSQAQSLESASDNELLQQYRRARTADAFETLLRRHGDLVLRVCRRVLGNSHDAEDAFQATFLLFARKAGSVRKHESLASFLHGMAYRVARNAARGDARRRHRERNSARDASSSDDALGWNEVQAVLDEEVRRLPVVCRSAFVQCCLESQSRADAARQLGITEVTLAGRLQRAKTTLKTRLARRGISLSMLLGAVSLAEACPRSALLASTARSALQFAAGEHPAGISPVVFALARNGMRPLAMPTIGILVLLMAGLLALATLSASSATGPAALNIEAGMDHPVQLEGIVQDEKQQPQPEVPVWLVLGGYDKETLDAKPLGKVVTDAHGRFRLEAPPTWRPSGYSRQFAHLGLFAYRPGFCPVVLSFHHDCRGLLKDIKLVLRKTESSRLTIWKAEQQPVRDAEVGVRVLLSDLLVALPPDADPELVGKYGSLKPHAGLAHGRLQSTFHISVPPELREIFRARTDAGGTATIKDMASSQISGWNIRPQGEPEVNAGKSPYKLDSPWPEGIILPAVGQLRGTIKSLAPLNGQKVHCWSSNMKTQILVRQNGKLTPSDGSQLVFLQSLATATVNEAGQFTTSLRQGYAGFHTIDHLPTGYIVVGGNQGADTITDKPVELALELKPSVRVTGVVQGKDGRPLSGVALMPYAQYDARASRLTTDEQGRFVLYCLPGELKFISLSNDQIPHLTARDLFAYRSNVPADVKEFTLPPLQVPTYTTLRGMVRDEGGKAVAGVTVMSRWLGLAESQLLRVQFRQVKTDTRGEFVLERIDPRKSYTLTAMGQGLGTTAALTLKDAGLTAPVSLTLRRDAAVRGGGQALDAAGKPLPGATVALEWRPPISANHFVPPPPLAAPGVGQAIAPEDLVPSVAELPVISFPLPSAAKTDALGRYLLPPVLGLDGEYRVAVSATGAVAATSGWVTAKAGQDIVFPSVSLQDGRPFAGQVTNRQGQPVAGAEVILYDANAKTRLRTDASGKFQFDRPALPDAFVCVSAAGYRFHGQSLHGTLASTIALTRLEEQPQTILRTLPPVLSPADRRKLAEDLFSPMLRSRQKEGDENNLLRPLEILAALDPARSLEELDKKPFKTDWFYDSVKQYIAKHLAREHLEEARTVVDSIQKPSSRCQAYLDLATSVPADKAPLKLDLLAQALLHARAETDAARRVLYEGKIANQFLAMGDSERGTRLLREAHDAAKGLPTSGWGAYARGAFAEELCSIDLPAAEKLCEAIEDKSEHTRHFGNLAHLMAAKQPEEAQRLLDKATKGQNDFDYGRYAERVCYRMATVDLDRAKEIASRVKTYHHAKARAYAQIAHAIAKTNRPEAEAVLRQAFAALAAGVTDRESDFDNIVDAPTVAASFLPIAEAIDPALVGEFLWQALSLRPDRQRAAMKPFARNRPTAGDITLALVLSRYDRKIAEQLLEAAVPSVVHGTDGSGREFFSAAAVSCPHRLREWLTQVSQPDYRDAFVEAAVEMLLADGETLWKQIHRKLFLWYADDVDV